VGALCVFDDGGGPALYAAGSFTSAGGNPARAVARWDGAHWSALGSGPACADMRVLAVYDDGNGPALYAGGASGGHVSGAAPGTLDLLSRWDGSSWSSMGSGITEFGSSLAALAVFDDGTGPALYVGGSFHAAGGVSVNNLAKWNGSTWSDVGGGTNSEVDSLAVFDDGSGPALVVGGGFSMAGGVPAERIAKWNGSVWSALGPGIGTGASSERVTALAAYDDGSGGGPDLYAGGVFTRAAGHYSTSIAEWLGCAGPWTALCAGDGTLRPCPCGNDGASGRGCQNSASTGGAVLVATGAVLPDTIVLHVSGELPSALTVFLQGNSLLPSSLIFGDGIRCAGGALKRLYAKNASGGAAHAPAAGDLSISARSAALGQPITTGASRWYQTYYRDPNPTFCPAPGGSTFNSSSAIRIDW
jgi:hypothetical protein